MGNNFIELNGKRYDALNGTLLGEGAQQVAGVRPRPTRQGRAVDGFVRAPKQLSSAMSQSVQTNTVPSPSVVAKTVTKPIDMMKPAKSRKSGVAVSAHQPQKAQTLMRTVVKKPEFTMKTKVKVQPPAEMAAKPVSALVPKKSALQVDERRLARARQAGQSSHIQRFTRTQQNHPAMATQNPVALAPAQSALNQNVALAAGRPRTEATTAANRSRSSGRYSGRTSFAQRPAIARANATEQQADVFEAALAQATAHNQPKVKHRNPHRKLINVMAIVGAFIIIGGFVTYLNVPNIELHLASAQAGFHVQLPHYKPTGYALKGGVHANNGVVTLSYRSGSSTFTLQQQPSNWDSQTLLDNVVSLAGTGHQTYQSQGRTVYMYGDNAAWVNGGILYSMKTGTLSSGEVTSIATSM